MSVISQMFQKMIWTIFCLMVLKKYCNYMHQKIYSLVQNNFRTKFKKELWWN